ncbi:unnamed protein product [Prorocentrum cordatum]|uniref:Uncharacterized protein n=1 Tax=Prorocentrum cordatum TaxID=2364126 RepID=A0ABN9SDG0_9DINO|nr:unnamed protein product [Polarella glacialis]
MGRPVARGTRLRQAVQDSDEGRRAARAEGSVCRRPAAGALWRPRGAGAALPLGGRPCSGRAGWPGEGGAAGGDARSSPGADGRSIGGPLDIAARAAVVGTTSWALLWATADAGLVWDDRGTDLRRLLYECLRRGLAFLSVPLLLVIEPLARLSE